VCARTSYPGGCRQSRLLAGLLAYCASRVRDVPLASSRGSAPAFPFDRTVAGRVIAARRMRSLQLRVQLRTDAPAAWQKHVPDSLLIHPVKDVEPTGVCERTGSKRTAAQDQCQAFDQNSKFGCATCLRPSPSPNHRSVYRARRPARDARAIRSTPSSCSQTL
jgi:hypothetical protein